MAKTFFTADTHFGHGNIIRYCSRPFSDVKTMDETLIRNWNERIGPDDLVYHLGDFGISKNGYLRSILERLQGHKVLILGSHDKIIIKSGLTTYFQEVVPFKTIQPPMITLCHYALRVWPSSHYGAFHLYGHSHGNLPPLPGSLDVGVDCHDFYPLELSEVLTILEETKKNH